MSHWTWTLSLCRLAFVVLVASIATHLSPFGLAPALSALLGAVLAVAVILAEIYACRLPLPALLAASLGFLLGSSLGLLLTTILLPAFFLPARSAEFFRLFLPLGASFLGILVGLAKADAIQFPRDIPSLPSKRKGALGSEAKLLDTSALIDGRIAEVAAIGFLSGVLIVPQFVLHELQSIADSADASKRVRGRRGLDVVKRLHATPGVSLEISSFDPESVREVDRKLIEAAKTLGVTIVTNDLNLGKLAQLQGLQTLNIHELASALRPIVMPGETVRVSILKEGKEQSQGVGYLDDGTMVVVENARRYISKTLEITITSIHQTSAGKIIFGRYDESSVPKTETRASRP